MGEKPAVPFEILQNKLPAVTNASPQMQEVIKKSMAYMAKDRIKTVAEFRKALGGEFTMKDVIIKEQPDPKTKIIQPPKSDTDTNVTHKEVVPKAPKHVDWIDVKQFLYQNKRINIINTIVNNKYFLYLKSLLVASRVILLAIMLLQIFFTFTEGWEEYTLFRMLARILNRMDINWCYGFEDFEFIVLWIIFGLVSIVLRCLKTNLNSSVLNKIYAIEQSDNEGDQELRTRSQKGKIGLCKKRKYSVKELLLTEYDEINKVAVDTFVCVKRGKLGLYKCTNFEAKEHLPMEYDAIYLCDKEVYICEQKGKKGVYNVELKKMMIPLEYDAIEPVPGNQLVAYKNGVPTKYTSKGFRVV